MGAIETKNKTTSLALQNLLQTTTAINLAEGKFDDIESAVGFAVKEILDRPPIAMLRKIEGMSMKLEMFLAIQIGKLINSVNIANNLNIQHAQIPIIAKQLIENYPIESLEDFVLCFKRGLATFYGTIYRLDAAVLNEWMKQYLDEKYTYVEAKVQEQQEQTVKANEVNYEKFKERVRDFVKEEKGTNFKENEYQRMKLANPYRYYDIRGLKIYATSEEHAEKLVQRLIELGEVEEVKE
jgi:polyhydroxyalkanoate synthesis regulator phasin